MQEIELYHVHLKNNSDRKWKVNSEIKVDEKFDSVMSQRQQNFSQLMGVGVDDKQLLTNFSTYISDYLNRIKDLRVIRQDDLDELKQLLELGYLMSYNSDFFKRESALENCRRDNFTDKPSRLHSIYLCDADGLEYWSDIISEKNTKEIEVFRVIATGNIFKTNEQLLPNELHTYIDTYNSSFSYWKPRFRDVPNFTNEYLAQGKIKVLSQIK